MRLFLWFSNTVQFQKISSFGSVCKKSIISVIHMRDMRTNDQNRWDSKGIERNAGKEEAKQPRLSLSTSTVNVCCCLREEATTSVFVCCGVYKGAFSFNFDLRILLCYQDERRVSNQPRTSTEVAWQNEGLLTQLCCNSWTLPFWNQRRDKSVNLICLSVSWD